MLAIALIASPAFAQEGCQGSCPSQTATVAKQECSGQCPSQTATVAKQEGCSGQCPSQTATVAKQEGCSGQCPSATATVAKQEGCSGGCPSAAVATVAATKQDEGKACSECPVAKAMANLPQMNYVVAGKTYDCKQKAFTALVENTESYVAKFTTPSKCATSGKTTIAGESCGCPVDAGKKTELVSAAIKDMKMTYKVGKESTCCSKSAGEMVKKSGEKMVYVVAGEETCCEMTARLNLAKAKYAAAVKAIATTASTEKKAAEAKSGS